MARTTDPDEMDMPCSCNHCGNWFDLQDGQRSEKWNTGTVICETCAQEEETEIELDEEIEDLKEELEEAKDAVDEATQAIYRIQKRLNELKVR